MLLKWVVCTSSLVNVLRCVMSMLQVQETMCWYALFVELVSFALRLSVPMLHWGVVCAANRY